MMAMRSVNKSCNRRTAFGELKVRLHKLIAVVIRGDIFDLAAIAAVCTACRQDRKSDKK